MKVMSLVGWNEPDGTRHEAGEVVEIDPSIVRDFDDLSFGKTVLILPDERSETKPIFKPAMETKEQK